MTVSPCNDALNKLKSALSIFVNSIIEDYGPSKIGTILNYLKYFNFEESVEKATSSSIDDISMEVFNIAYK